MTTITPEPIMDLLGGVLAAKYLFVATELELFTRLAPRPATLDDLAAQVGVPRRTLRLLVDALVASHFLDREGDQYRNSAVTMAFLSGGSGPDLRPIVRLWNQVVYPQWLQLEAALQSNQPTFGFADFTVDQHRIFTAGVEALTAPAAQALAATYDFSHHQRVLDLGGGTGSFLRAILEHYPAMQGTLVERPATAALVRQGSQHDRLATPFEIIEGNFLDDPIPPGYDAIILANVLHLFSPAHNQALLQRIRAAAADQAHLLLVDFWTDATHIRPPFAALMAGEFQIVTGEGDVYSVEEVGAWWRTSGWRLLDHRPLAGAASVIVALRGPA